MMKKSKFLAASIALVLAVGAGTAHAQQVGIDAAIRSVAEGVSTNIGGGASVAVLSMQAGSVRMSDYLIDETIGALTWLHGGQGFTTMNRAQFYQGMGGLQVNMAGPVDSSTIQAVGRLLGVRYVVTGTFEPLADFFRFRAQLIDVGSAAIRGMHTADVQNDSLVAYLLAATGPAPVAAAPVAPVPTAGTVVMTPVQAVPIGQFTVGQRWATWFLNGIPGLGSFVVMGDRGGGWFQVICAGLGFTAMLASNTFLASTRRTSWGTQYRVTNIPVLTVGWLLVATWQIYNPIRSFTFGRRGAAVAAASVPWDLAFAPGKNGIEGVTLSHTMRF